MMAVSKRTVGRVVLVTLLLAAGLSPTAFAAPPDNDDHANATVVGSLPFTSEVDLTEATTEADEPQCYGYAVGSPAAGSPDEAVAHRERRLEAMGLKVDHPDGGPDTQRTVWYSYSPDVDGRLLVDTSASGADQDTIVAVYRQTKFGLERVGCDDDGGEGLTARLIVDVAGGSDYLVQVGAFNGNADRAVVEMTEAPPRAVLTGTVTAEDTGEPLEGICVDVYGDGDWGWDSTDADGSWEVLLDSSTARIEFYQCWWTDHGSEYEGEFYDDQQSYEDATEVTLVPGETHTADASLAVRPSPPPWPESFPDYAVTDVSVEHHGLVADGVEFGVGAGTSRTVHVTVAKAGVRSWAEVRVFVCPVSMSTCDELESVPVHLDDGQTITTAHRWNAIGAVGDVEIVAVADSECVELDWSDNRAEVDDYAVVGGTGSGVGASAMLGRRVPGTWCSY